jgi:hypothetical protein
MTTTIPSWLNPAMEIKKESDLPEEYTKLDSNHKTTWYALKVLKALYVSYPELTTTQALWILGNMIAETGWFRSDFRGNNIAGWKINESYVKEYQKIYLRDPKWYQKEGHLASGDPPIVYYRAYDSIQEFCDAWVRRFIPKNCLDTKHRYYKASLEFWKNESINWFKELCLAGYKGPVTQAKPEGSINGFASICIRAKKILAQELLGVEPDGAWGNTSKEVCKKRFLIADGSLTDEIFNLLIEEWKVLPLETS